jgi:hypothetical protein
MMMGSLSISFPIIIQKLLNRWNINIFPSGYKHNDLNEISDEEIKFWALHANIFDMIKSNPKEKYEELKHKLNGEKLKALEYFYNEYFKNDENLI